MPVQCQSQIQPSSQYWCTLWVMMFCLIWEQRLTKWQTVACSSGNQYTSRFYQLTGTTWEITFVGSEVLITLAMNSVGFQFAILCSSERTCHLEEHSSSIFRVEEKPADILLGFSYELEDGSDIFLWNGGLSSNCMVLQPIKPDPLEVNFAFQVMWWVKYWFYIRNSYRTSIMYNTEHCGQACSIPASLRFLMLFPHFLLCPFKFIIHPSTYHSMLYSMGYWQSHQINHKYIK